MKITGLDALQKELDRVQKVLGDLDGELGVVNFDPHDPASIEGAISQVDQMIDERVGSTPQSEIVRNIVEEMKEHYRTALLEKAAEARLTDET